MFRGLSEAKYKLFNSAQRYWEKHDPDNRANDELYDEFVIELISRCKKWNQGSIPRLFETYKINKKNSVAYLGFMQHHSIATPLLDYTKDPNKAFFFATSGIKDFKESKNEMDNYFSIYFTYQNNPAFEIFEEVFNKNRKSEPEDEFDYINISKHGIILISERREDFKILNNMRIVNQEGIFFFNHSPIEPIEDVYKGFIDLLIEKKGEKYLSQEYIPSFFCGCLNINKKNVPLISERLEGLGIINEFIMPDVELLRQECMNE